MEKHEKLQYAKVILTACFMVAASMGLCFYSGGVFYQPLANGLNITLGQASSATTFMLVFMALTALCVPYLLRKVKLQTLLLIGTALTCSAVLFVSFSFNRYFVYSFCCLMGAGAALIGMVPATTLINNWFEQKKNWTTSIVLAASALSTALFSPLMAASVEALGWRMGFVIQAVLILVLMSPALYWHVPLHPASAGKVPYGQEEVPANDKRKTPRELLFSFALIAVFSAFLVALPMHYSSLASSIGKSALMGATALSWCMIGNLVFKLGAGWVADRIKPVLASGLLDIFALIATIGITILILMHSGNGLYVLCFLFGSAFALNELCLPLLVSNRVSRRYYSTIYALLNFLSTLTTALMISLVGYMYDRLASYLWVYIIAIVMEVLIAGLIYYLIANEKMDDLVTNDVTRTFIERIRDERKKRQMMSVEKKRQKAVEQKMSQSASNDEKAQPTQSVFHKQMALFDEEEGKDTPVSTTVKTEEPSGPEFKTSPEDTPAPVSEEENRPAEQTEAPVQETEETPAASDKPEEDSKKEE